MIVEWKEKNRFEKCLGDFPTDRMWAEGFKNRKKPS